MCVEWLRNTLKAVHFILLLSYYRCETDPSFELFYQSILIICASWISLLFHIIDTRPRGSYVQFVCLIFGIYYSKVVNLDYLFYVLKRPMLLQFNKEESLHRLPLSECWVVRTLFHWGICITSSFCSIIEKINFLLYFRSQNFIYLLTQWPQAMTSFSLEM